MFDLGKEKININCPSCNRKQAIMLRQVGNAATIRCVCGNNIKIQAKGGSSKQAINKLNEAFKKLGSSFKR